MNILFLMSSLATGGTERQMAILAPALVRRGHSITVVVPFAGDHYESQLKESGVRVISTRMTRAGTRPSSIWPLLMIALLVRVTLRERFDVVHAFGRTANSLSVAFRPLHQARVIWGIRHSGPVGVFEQLKIKLLSKYVDVLVTNSEAGKSAYVAGSFPDHKAVVINNGIDTDKFLSRVNDRNAVRRVLNLKDDQILIGTVGRLIPQKNHRLFIETASIVARQRNDVRFLVVGGGNREFANELSALADRLSVSDRLIWAGSRSDVERYMSAMDVFVSTSDTEGFPNVIAEAMATGLPCIVTDVGDSERIVNRFGEVVAPGNAQDVAQAVLRTIDRLPYIQADPIRQYIVENYSIGNLVDRTEQLISDGLA